MVTVRELLIIAKPTAYPRRPSSLVATAMVIRLVRAKWPQSVAPHLHADISLHDIMQTGSSMISCRRRRQGLMFLAKVDGLLKVAVVS